MIDFHRNTKVHKHYIDLLLFFCHHRHRSKKEEYRDLLFVRFFLTFYMEIITLLCVNLFFSLMFSTLLQRKLTT